MLLYRLYRLIAPLLLLVFRLISPQRKKWRQVVEIRKDLFLSLENKIPADHSRKRFWFHSTSVGEFEQAKPIIKLVRERLDPFIIVTVYSPSIYEKALEYDLADLVYPLPFDTFSNARRFVETIQPDVFIAVKFDLWPNHLLAAKEHGTRTYLVSATLQPHSHRLKPFIRSAFRYVYAHLDHIFAVSPEDAQRFQSLLGEKENIRVIGDTRFDQVYERYRQSLKQPPLLDFQDNRDRLILGSIWPQDWAVLAPALIRVSQQRKLFTIIVPHEIEESFMKKIRTTLDGGGLSSRLWSEMVLDKTVPHDLDAVIVDTVGILSRLYLLTDFAYVGGSFTTGVHNVMEPAICAQPVMFGPLHHNSPEALALVKLGPGIPVKSSSDVERTLLRLTRLSPQRKYLALTAKDYIMSNVGSAEKITNILCENEGNR